MAGPPGPSTERLADTRNSELPFPALAKAIGYEAVSGRFNRSLASAWQASALKLMKLANRELSSDRSGSEESSNSLMKTRCLQSDEPV